ncbi:hypothetical protein QUF70_09255 [Desulfobacterales bacterium HSG17]|nr:hypothetical protein [Desulfobacterales bacterium HSG17]
MKKQSKKDKKKKKFKKKTSSVKSHKTEIREVTKNPHHYQIGDYVIVKNGIRDPDYGTDISGWKGRIYNVENDDDPFIDIRWDGETLESMPESIIEACEKEELEEKQMRLRASLVELYASDEKSGKMLLKTMTDEVLMLARIYYDLVDKVKVQEIFSKIRCMNYNSSKNRWEWLYEKEAKKLKFAASYYSIPVERRPIILGSFYSNKNDEMYIDVNSFDRAKIAVLFFDKYIPRTVARVTDIEVLNKVFDSYDGTMPNPDDYFNSNDEKLIRNPEAIMDEILNMTSSIEDPAEKLQIAMKQLVEDAKQPLAKLERFPTNYYEDGSIIGLEGSLKARENLALHHWAGNKDITLFDIIHGAVQKLPPLNL